MGDTPENKKISNYWLIFFTRSLARSLAAFYFRVVGRSGRIEGRWKKALCLLPAAHKKRPFHPIHFVFFVSFSCFEYFVGVVHKGVGTCGDGNTIRNETKNIVSTHAPENWELVAQMSAYYICWIRFLWTACIASQRPAVIDSKCVRLLGYLIAYFNWIGNDRRCWDFW